MNSLRLIVFLVVGCAVTQAQSVNQKPKMAKPIRPGITTPSEQASAHETVMRFLQGIKIAALPEGKQLLSETQWILGVADRGSNFYSRPHYTDVNSIFASLFSTDIPNVEGYKELFDMKTVTKEGTTANAKFLVIAYKDGTTGKWKIMESIDNLHDESDLDIESQVIYAASQLKTTMFPAQMNYLAYGHWSLLFGHLAEARAALNTAKTASSVTSDARGLSWDDPIRALQINALLTVIDRITSGPQTVN